MKTKSNNYNILIISVITVMIALLIPLFFIGCLNSGSNSPTSEKELDSAFQETGGGMFSDDQSLAEELEITSSVINISDLYIKEDLGDDVVILEGPYTIEINNGIANLDQVDVFPGTYKKVNLTFQTGDSTTLNGNSIIITGNFINADGKTIPFTLSSDYTKQIQLPLVNDGVTVYENSTVPISIIFDVNAWLSVLDFANAQVTDGKITIDNKNNRFLLSLFEANLSSINAENIL